MTLQELRSRLDVLLKDGGVTLDTTIYCYDKNGYLEVANEIGLDADGDIIISYD